VLFEILWINSVNNAFTYLKVSLYRSWAAPSWC